MALRSLNLHWGTGLFLLLAGFAAFMGAFLLIAVFHERRHSVPDAYTEELRTDARRTAQQRVAELGGVTVAWSTQQQLVGRVPLKIPGATRLLVALQHASQTNADRHFEVQTHPNGTFTLPVPGAVRGHYSLRINWAQNGVAYEYVSTLSLY